MEELSWVEVGHRVREARIAAAMSQANLSSLIGLDRTAVVKIESGKRQVSALEMFQLADALGLPLAHFLSRPPAVLSHRAELTDDTTSAVGQQSFKLKAALETWLRDIRQLQRLQLLLPPRPLSYDGMVGTEQEACLAARWARETLGLNEKPINSMMVVCEQAGQLVAVDKAEEDGASAVDGDVAAAVVSVSGDPGRRRATAAHELGHMILGDEYSSDLGVHTSRGEREGLIDTFAGEFLLPTEVVAETLSRGGDQRSALIRLAAEYKVSWALATRQAAGIVQLTRGLRERIPTRAELMSAVGWTPQPDLESIRVPPVFADAVLKAWTSSHVTATRAVELMRGQISESDLPERDESNLTP